MDGERHLRPRDRFFLLACAVIAAVSLAVGIYLFPMANSEASIRFDVDREQSEQVALEFLGRSEVRGPAEASAEGEARSLSDYRHAGQFVYDDESRVFLERELGLEETSRLVTGPVRIWRWGHRWFRPLEKETFRVEVATTGKVARYEHELDEEAPGARLPREEARQRAEEIARAVLGFDPARLEFLEAQTVERDHRTDHVFVWRDPSIDLREGSYRYEVALQGDQLGRYHEYVKVPEAWSLDFKALRSKNDTTATIAGVLLGLTVLAICVVLFRRIRFHDIRWRTAGMFGLVGAVLAALSQLNDVPAQLYQYQTTESWNGFLLGVISSALIQGAVSGVLIFAFVASGEALYREMYPDKISLGRFFTFAGFRTRRFLLATVLGATMSCVFFLYQEVFYIVAQRLGAWAPTEIPYDNLLNTAFPWIFVLLAGFLPSVMEESMSRMFSIPFLQKHTRSVALAVVVPAFIWGFAHANYPNLPFYIRGLEVGIAGIAVGVVMLRMNILACLVWHYLVDALYTSILLFRSGNAYYIVSAAVASGIILVPLGYAIVAYLRHREFTDVEPLRNLREPGPEELPVSEIEIMPPPPVATWSPRRRTAFAAFSVLLLLTLLLPAPPGKDSSRRVMGREEALATANGAMRDLGEKPDSFRVAIAAGPTYSAPWARYLLRHGGAQALETGIQRYDAGGSWAVRYFRPNDPHEVQLRLGMDDGSLVRIDRRVAEGARGASLESASAQEIARRFLRERGIDPEPLVLRESSAEKRPNRLDHRFAWEAPENDPRNVGNAKHRVEVMVQGDRIGAFEQRLDLPDSWEDARKKKTAMWGVRVLSLILVGGAFLGMALWILVRGHRRGEVRWQPCLLWALPFGLLTLLSSLNAWPRILLAYTTEIPWNTFVLSTAATLTLSATFVYFVIATALAGMTTRFPDIWSLRDRAFRRALLPDALLSALLVLSLAIAFDQIFGQLPRWAPSLADPGSAMEGAALSSVIPWFQVFAGSALGWAWQLALITLAIGVLTHGLWSKPVLAALVAGAVIALVPLETRGAGEFLVALAPILIMAGAGFLLARFVLRDNLLAYPLAIAAVVVAGAVGPLLASEGAYFRHVGLLGLLLLLLPVAWFLASTLRPSRSR
jgi:membrane protease YdiL (CAAX protease family)